jgi:hypothetical protein
MLTRPHPALQAAGSEERISGRLLCRKTEVARHVLQYPVGRIRRRLGNPWCGLPSELRSFRGHIQILFATKLYQEGLLLESLPAQTPIEYETYRNRLESRNQHTRDLESSRPWVGLVDVQLFADGWNKGVEFSFRTGEFASLRTQPQGQDVTPYSSPATDSIIAKLSKCDPSIPPRLQQSYVKPSPRARKTADLQDGSALASKLRSRNTDHGRKCGGRQGVDRASRPHQNRPPTPQ